MKKIISLFLVFVLVLSFAACKESNEEQTTSEVISDNGAPVVSLLCEKTEVSAGESVEVVLHIADSQYTACFDIFVYTDEKLIYESNRSAAGETDLILAANYMEEETGNYVAVRGIVASTADLMDNDIYKIVYKVADTAVSGDKLSVNMQVPAYQLGVDESGNDVYSVTEDIKINNLVLTVK